MSLGTTVALIGAPLEEGCGRRGCLMGPDALRSAGIAEMLTDLGHKVIDHGNITPEALEPITPPFPALKNYTKIAAWTRALYACAGTVATRNVFPIYMGGDHAMSLGTVAGHAAAAADVGRPLFVLWLDAHSDFHTLETTQSGNLHGTPLAYVCGLPGFEDFMGAPVKHVVPFKNVEILGVRSIDPEERSFLRRYGVGVSDMRSIDETGIPALLGPFLDRVRAAKGLLHVSFDLDFLDPDIAPAVGTTVPGGATFREAHLVMEMLHDSGLVTSLDLVELNPFLDERGKSARLLVDLVSSLFGRRVFDRPTRSY